MDIKFEKGHAVFDRKAVEARGLKTGQITLTVKSLGNGETTTLETNEIIYYTESFRTVFEAYFENSAVMFIGLKELSTGTYPIASPFNPDTAVCAIYGKGSGGGIGGDAWGNGELNITGISSEEIEGHFSFKYESQHDGTVYVDCKAFQATATSK